MLGGARHVRDVLENFRLGGPWGLLRTSAELLQDIVLGVLSQSLLSCIHRQRQLLVVPELELCRDRNLCRRRHLLHAVDQTELAVAQDLKQSGRFLVSIFLGLYWPGGNDCERRARQQRYRDSSNCR